jgi:predicted negative regulator of RcsB-dependent stress response
MQTQDAPAELLFKLWPWLEANKNRIIIVVAAVLLLTGIYYFINAQHEQNELNAGVAMTQLLLTPSTSLTQASTSLNQLADKYNGTEAAKRALLQGAASLFGAGQYPEAQAQFQKYLDASPTGPLAATAQLGLAASLDAQGKTDEAVAAYQRASAAYPGTSSELAADCALGRIFEAQGKWTEAMNVYQNAMRAGRMGGSLAQAAYERAMTIKAMLQAQQQASPAAKAATAPAATPATPTLVLPEK